MTGRTTRSVISARGAGRAAARSLVLVVVLALFAAACGDDADDADTATEPGESGESGESTTTTTSTTAATSTTATTSTTSASTSTTTESGADPQTSLPTSLDALEAAYESVLTADLDGDGVEEFLAFDAVEPPVTALVFEPDPHADPDTNTAGDVVPVLLGGEPLTLDYTYYTGPARPDGEAWFGCADLDGSGIERVVRGTFVFDEAAGETRWTLQPIEWAADLVAVEGATVTGAYPAAEWSLSDLMPGRRLCKTEDISVAIADGCSAEGLVPPPTPSVLGDAAAGTYRAIADAAVACDFHELGRIAAAEITLSFGGHDDVAAFLAGGEYLWGGEPLRVLVQLLAMEPGFDENFDTWVWPPFWADDQSATAGQRAQIEAIFGVPFDEILVEGIGYIDYRIGIDTDGEWLFFVAGD